MEANSLGITHTRYRIIGEWSHFYSDDKNWWLLTAFSPIRYKISICVSFSHLLQLIQIPWQQLKANFIPPSLFSVYNENCICSFGWTNIDRRREKGAHSINEWPATKIWWSSRFLPTTPIQQIRATRPFNAKHKWRWILIQTEHYDLSLLSLVLNQPITVHCNHVAIFQSMPIW